MGSGQPALPNFSLWIFIIELFLHKPKCKWSWRKIWCDNGPSIETFYDLEEILYMKIIWCSLLLFKLHFTFYEVSKFQKCIFSKAFSTVLSMKTAWVIWYQNLSATFFFSIGLIFFVWNAIEKLNEAEILSPEKCQSKGLSRNTTIWTPLRKCNSTIHDHFHILYKLLTKSWLIHETLGLIQIKLMIFGV